MVYVLSRGISVWDLGYHKDGFSLSLASLKKIKIHLQSHGNLCSHNPQEHVWIKKQVNCVTNDPYRV